MICGRCDGEVIALQDDGGETVYIDAEPTARWVFNADQLTPGYSTAPLGPTYEEHACGPDDV